MFANLRAWPLFLMLLFSLSNELSMESTLTLFFLKGFSIASTKFFFKKHKTMEIDKHMEPRA